MLTSGSITLGNVYGVNTKAERAEASSDQKTVTKPYPWLRFMAKEAAEWYQAALNTLQTSDQDNRHRSLEELPDSISGLMKFIFNNSFKNGEIQKDWKNANDLLVPTKGKLDAPGNYRLDGVTSILGKNNGKPVRD